MKKRLVSAILSFFMLLTMAPTVAFAADGDDEAAHQNNSVLEGSCGAEGDNVTWKLTENDDSLYCAVANGIVNGSNGKLNPQNNATRAEVAAILMRFCEMGK